MQDSNLLFFNQDDPFAGPSAEVAENRICADTSTGAR
jgi:hypothetical protein